MKKRSPVLVILLGMITGGIYMLYWYISTTNGIERSLKNSNGKCRSGALWFIFSIITFGIYQFYWWYQENKRVVACGQENGVSVSDHAVISVVLMFFGIGALVNTILLQSSINSVVDAIEKNGAAPTAA